MRSIASSSIARIARARGSTKPRSSDATAARIADARAAGRDRDVGRGERRAAEHQRLRCAIGSRRNPARRVIGPPSCATRLPPPRPIDSTSGIRKFVRTPPISTAIEHSRGKPPRQHADVGGRAADVHDDAIVEAAEKAAAAHAVGRAGGERQHRVARGQLAAHQACRRSGSRRSGQRMPSRGERVAERARRRRPPSPASAAFMIAAFSRSSRPMRPIWLRA